MRVFELEVCCLGPWLSKTNSTASENVTNVYFLLTIFAYYMVKKGIKSSMDLNNN